MTIGTRDRQIYAGSSVFPRQAVLHWRYPASLRKKQASTSDGRDREEVYTRSVGYRTVYPGGVWSGTKGLRHIGDQNVGVIPSFSFAIQRRRLDIKLLLPRRGSREYASCTLERPNNMGTFGFLEGAVGCLTTCA